MSKQMYPLTVKEIRPETDDCVSISFSIPDEFKDLFSYQAGQYLTLVAQIDGKEVRRSYSLCSSPLDKEWRVAVKKVYKGVFSTFANEKLQVGDIIQSYPPEGHFTVSISEQAQKHYVAFAAGSGITPILSLIKTILRTEPKSRFTLFFGNRNASSIIFKEELEALKNSYMTRFRLYHVLSRQPSESPLFDGRIDAQKCRLFFQMLLQQPKPDDIFLCGPAEMIFGLREQWQELGLPDSAIHFELFSSPDDHKKTEETQSLAEEVGSGYARITLKLDGKLFEFELEKKGENLLDAGIKNGADLPFSCKGGVCSTCKAKIIEGDVYMTSNYALEEDEVSEGYVLSCQSHPRSDTLYIDFDQ